MITVQSKKYKNKPAVIDPSKNIVRQLQPVSIMKKSIIYHPQYWRYFFTRKNTAGQGLKPVYKYKAKKGMEDIINRAMFMHRKGYYKSQKVV